MDSELAARGSGNKQGALYPLLQGSKSVIAELNAECYQYAVSYYKTLLQSGTQFDHQWCGVLQQAFKPELESRLKKFSDVWPDICQFIDAERSSNIAKIPLPFSSVYYPDGGWLSPYDFCHNLSDSLKKKFNFEIFQDSKVTAISKTGSTNDSGKVDNNNWQLTLKSNEHSETSRHFNAVVICAGHLSNKISNLSSPIPLQSVRGQVSRLNNTNPMNQLSTVLCHKGYATPSQGEYQSFGATFNKDNNDETVNDLDTTKNIEQIQKVYSGSQWAKEITYDQVVGSKAAIRATSPDHMPLAGELFSNNWLKNFVDKNTGNLKRIDKLPNEFEIHQDSDLRGLFTLTGLGARGITTAPLMEKELTNKMFGVDATLSERLQKAIAPMRFQVRNLKKNKSKTQ